MRVYSHSHWLAIFCTTNNSPVLAREMWKNTENFREKLFLHTLYKMTFVFQKVIEAEAQVERDMARGKRIDLPILPRGLVQKLKSIGRVSDQDRMFLDGFR